MWIKYQTENEVRQAEGAAPPQVINADLLLCKQYITMLELLW